MVILFVMKYNSEETSELDLLERLWSDLSLAALVVCPLTSLITALRHILYRKYAFKLIYMS